jgi:hypothetical protein
MSLIDARHAYDVWLRLIADEELYQAMLDGQHRTFAAARGMDEEALAILDAFRAAPGTRWNIENLRFRAALECGATLASYLPRTMKLLTKGDDDWLQDVCYEYLSRHRWQEEGHFRFAECERFARYVRERIMKRRYTPPHLEVVLEFELAVVRLLQRTASIAREAWTVTPATEAELGELVLRRGPAVDLVDLPVDIRAWVSSGDPTSGAVHPGPITLLIYVPSLAETHRIKSIGEGPRRVLEYFDRPCSVSMAIAELSAEFDAERLRPLIRAWYDECVLVAVPAE